MQVGKIRLEEPCLFGEVGMDALLVLVGDDATGIATGCIGGLDLVVLEEVSLAGIAILDHLIVLDGILVAVGADAPDMEGEDSSVLVEGNGDDALLATLRAKDFDDVAIVFDGGTVGGDGVGGVVQENDGIGLGCIGGELLRGGDSNPVGNVVLMGGRGGYREEQQENGEGREMHLDQ